MISAHLKSIGVFLTFLPLFSYGSERSLTRADVITNRDKLELAHPGAEVPIQYKKYGIFHSPNTAKYRYVIKNKTGLAAAAGEGVFPNQDITKDPAYQKLKREKQLEGSHWNYVDTRNSARNFYKWATTQEDPGVRQFYVGIMLERSGLLEQAIKSFYAVVVHFPKTVAWTYYKTPWYVGPTSMDRVEQLLRRHPHLNMVLEEGKFAARNIFDVDVKNDSISTDPGTLRKKKKLFGKNKEVNLAKLPVVKTIGGPKIQLRKYKNGHWQLFVDGKPFVIRGINYSVTPVGLSPDRGTWNNARDWQLLDTDKNGVHDGFFEAFIDKNKNNQRDKDEELVGDAQLLKELGINTLRAYHHIYDKNLFRRLHEDYGLYVMCGDLLGGYATGSGAKWEDGTDYKNLEQRKKMLESVRSMVEENKEEPYVLMWVLGNENVYGVANNSQQATDEFFQLVNEAAKLVHELDPTRPVMYVNGDLAYLEYFQKRCPDVDIFGANVYRGEQGFGRHLFLTVKDKLDSPTVITEFGAPAYAEDYTIEEAEAYQAMYVANNWEDLEAHLAGQGVGNSLGGVLFEYVDEWWKANSDLPAYVQKERAVWYQSKSALYKNLQPDVHDTVPQFGLPFLDGWSYEEWMGFMSLGDGRNSSFVRQPRPVYHTIKQMLGKYQNE